MLIATEFLRLDLIDRARYEVRVGKALQVRRILHVRGKFTGWTRLLQIYILSILHNGIWSMGSVGHCVSTRPAASFGLASSSWAEMVLEPY